MVLRTIVGFRCERPRSGGGFEAGITINLPLKRAMNVALSCLIAEFLTGSSELYHWYRNRRSDLIERVHCSCEYIRYARQCEDITFFSSIVRNLDGRGAGTYFLLIDVGY